MAYSFSRAVDFRVIVTDPVNATISSVFGSVVSVSFRSKSSAERLNFLKTERKSFISSGSMSLTETSVAPTK